MRSRAALAGSVALVLFALALVAGCAGVQGTGRNVPNDPHLIRNELRDLEQDIANAEELIKGYKAELNQKESAELRGEIRELEMQLYEFRAQKAALEERLREIEAEESAS